MKQTLLLILFVTAFRFTAQSQDLVFAGQFGGSDTQASSSVAADDSGNIFVSTVFNDEVDADPGTNVVLLNAAGSGDVALVKLSSAGDFTWAIQLGGTGFETTRKVLTDDEGNVLITGYFDSTIDFDPGTSTYNLTAVGGQDGFLAKYDHDGNFIWAYNIGSSGFEEFYGLDVDSSGNVYTTGYFQNTIDFNPGIGVANLTAINSNALFFWKLDKDGNFIWAKQIASVFAGDLHLDDDANILFTGSFYGTIDFNPDAATFNLSATGFGYDAFVLKLNENGIFQWAGSMSGSSEETGLSIWFDNSSQNILVGGRYQGTVDFDPSGITYNLISAGYHDAFVECFSSSGTFVWAKSFGGAGFEEVNSLQTDASKNIHLAGVFEQTCDFDPSNDIFNLTSSGYTDGYIAMWDSSGNFTSTFQLGGVIDDWIAKMILDDEGSILACGNFSWIVDFDPGVDTVNLSSFTGWDGFVVKYCTTYTIENLVSICEGDSFLAGGAMQTEAGVYYDYFDPSIGCDSTVITYISINHPAVDLGNDTSICENDFLVLDAGNPGSDYQWSNGDTTQMIEAEGGIFSVTISDAAGCIAHDTITLAINLLPQADLGNNMSICEGDYVLLDAGNSGAQYQWSNGDTTQMIEVGGGVFSVTVTDAAGCVVHDTIVIAVNLLPQVNLGNDVSICEGDSVLLDAENSGADYLWNTGETSQSIYVSSSSLYYVVVTDGNVCSNKDTLEVTVHLLPQISFTNSPDTIVCLTSLSIELPAAIPSGGEYSGSGVNGNLFTPAIAGIGEHAVTYTFTDTIGCIGDSTFTITVTICDGIETANASSIRIYPNPSNGTVMIERNPAIEEVINVADVHGKTIKQLFLPALARAEINLTDLAEGVYFLYENSGTQSLIGKIFILGK